MEWRSIAALALVLFAIPKTGVAQGFLTADQPPPGLRRSAGASAKAEASAKAVSPAALVVRTYNNYGVASDDLHAARTHVEATFKNAGIDILWVDCWYRDKEVAGASTQCRQPLGADQVVLRLQAAQAVSGKRYVSMGFSLVNLEEGVPFLATVFVDLVASISRSGAIDFRLLLGRAIAHEIGHLLLNTSRHADQGLMRADWSRAELRQNNVADWAFRDAEIATMQQAAASRSPEGRK